MSKEKRVELLLMFSCVYSSKKDKFYSYRLTSLAYSPPAPIHIG